MYRQRIVTVAATLLLVISLGADTARGEGDVEAQRIRDLDAAHAAIAVETARYGGWEPWFESLRPYHARWREKVATAPELGDGVFAGEDGFLFLRKWEDYLLETNYVAGMNGRSAALRTLQDLNDQLLARGIHFIVAPVPSRSEIYPEKVVPDPPGRPVEPARKRFIQRLLELNVEAIDLLPTLTAAKADGPVSLTNDPHWTSQGAAAAAGAIAARLSRYDWASLYGRPPQSLTTRTVPYNRGWAILERVSAENQADYPAGPVPVLQVRLPDDQPYAPDPEAPLLITGDSFLYYFNGVQADVAAHIGANLGYPVAAKPIGGGQAPRVAREFARMPPEELARHKVIVFIFVAPYLRYDTWQPAPLRPLDGVKP